jgi:DNA-binding NarL/FixJ family response regulator
MSGNGSAPSNAATRLLIADDHPTVRDAVASIIRTHRPQWGICPGASDGREAIVRATELRPDIVIMDYKMPQVDGLEAAREIRRTVPEVEVLIFTGTDLPYTLAEIYHSKVCGCLLKSEENENLLPAIESVGLHHRFRSRRLSELIDRITASEGKTRLLTPREKETACLIANGKTTKEIAVKLGLSEKTIDTHRSNAFEKLNIHSGPELTRHAVRQGWVA